MAKPISLSVYPRVGKQDWFWVAATSPKGIRSFKFIRLYLQNEV